MHKQILNRLSKTAGCVVLFAALATLGAQAQAQTVKREGSKQQLTKPASAKKVVSSRKTARVGTGVKRKPVVRASAPPKPSFGQIAGLHGAADALDLKSSVALVIDQDTREVLFSKTKPPCYRLPR